MSQGVKLFDTESFEEALIYQIVENNDWADYCQRCADEYEPAADNEIFMYEEKDDSTINKIGFNELFRSGRWNKEYIDKIVNKAEELSNESRKAFV